MEQFCLVSSLSLKLFQLCSLIIASGEIWQVLITEELNTATPKNLSTMQKENSLITE